MPAGRTQHRLSAFGNASKSATDNKFVQHLYRAKKSNKRRKKRAFHLLPTIENQDDSWREHTYGDLFEWKNYSKCLGSRARWPLTVNRCERMTRQARDRREHLYPSVEPFWPTIRKKSYKCMNWGAWIERPATVMLWPYKWRCQSFGKVWSHSFESYLPIKIGVRLFVLILRFSLILAQCSIINGYPACTSINIVDPFQYQCVW